MIKKITFLFIIFFSLSFFSQELSLDKYKYVIIPIKFDFLKNENQYQTSSLLKFLLKKKGFTVFLENEDLPNDLLNNRCSALTAVATDKSSFVTIKNAIVIKDCFGKVLYTSEVGKSKLKDYKRGYQEAIKRAYATMEDFNYSYNPDKVEVVDDIKEEKIITKKDAVKVIPKPKPPIKKTEVTKKVDKAKPLPVLYAQSNDNGYQLVNTKPEVIFVILKTSKEDFFIIKNKSGTLYKMDSIWIAEYYINGKLVQEKYQIKF